MKKMFGCTGRFAETADWWTVCPGQPVLGRQGQGQQPAVQLALKGDVCIRSLYCSWFMPQKILLFNGCILRGFIKVVDPVTALQQVAAVRCSAFAPADGRDPESVLAGIRFLAAVIVVWRTDTAHVFDDVTGALLTRLFTAIDLNSVSCRQPAVSS